MKLINEHELGICKMTQDLEKSYLESCEHNNTTPEDLEYFRSYIWALFAILKRSIEKSSNHIN